MGVIRNCTIYGIRSMMDPGIGFFIFFGAKQHLRFENWDALTGE